MEGCEVSLISINPKPIEVPSVITKLIRTVNHFTEVSLFSQAIAQRISYLVLRCIGEQLEVLTLRSPQKY